MNKLFLGFELGLLIAILAYIFGHLTRRSIPGLRSGLIILAAPLFIFYHLPLGIDNSPDGYATINLFSVFKILGASLLLAVVLGAIVQMVHSLYGQLTKRDVSQHTHHMIRQFFYIGALIIPTLIILLTTRATIEIYYDAVLACLALSFGLWISLKLFWADNIAQ